MADVTPGVKTSEFKMALVAQALGVVGAIVPPLWVFASSVADTFPEVRWIAAVVSVLSLLWTVLAALGYAKQRTELKKVALTAGKVLMVLLVAGSLLVPPRALATGFGVVCLSDGCETARLRQAQFGKLRGPGDDVQLTSVLWAGPGLGAMPSVYNGATKEWHIMASPVFAYGIWWRPPGWTATRSLLGLNLSVFGEISGSPQAHLDPILTVNLMDNLQVGGGVKARFATSTMAGGLDPLFAIFWTTSIGGP